MGDGSMAWSMATAVVSSFLMAYVLAHLTSIAHSYSVNSESTNTFMRDALLTGFWSFVGFYAVRTFMRGEFNQRRKKETLIHVMNDFVTILAMVLIIGALGVK